MLTYVAAAFLAISTLTRLGLLAFDAWAGGQPLSSQWPRVFATGLLYDSAALAYVLAPFALLALPWPNSARGRTAHALTACTLFALSVAALLFVAVAEALFWNEFGTRFNFIAVDYLVYTQEVIGNIVESYPVYWILGAIAALALAVTFTLGRRLWRAAMAEGGRLRERFVATLAVLALPFASFAVVDEAPRDALALSGARELAANGPYEFMRAFRHNDLDFLGFYRTLPDDEARAQLRGEFAEAGSTARFLDAAHPLERRIEAPRPARPANLVLVSIESLGSDYVESFGGMRGFTPNLDRLARESMVFTNLYATGLRTVRGLEALTLSLPPTPGHAVPMRVHNKGFQTLGGVLREQGYESLYIYGGYSRFDNMRDFFGGNGYTVIDRTAIAAKDITHETIWGVADEDLFRLTIREMDARTAGGTKIFAHVMTTSNHRPFTYPAGRIDIPSGSGRDGGVKYTDWAIGQFLHEAATRPWFANTIFVFVADHTSNGRGRTDLPPENYRIPMLIYAPGIVAPRCVNTIASQIDVAPTLLALLDVSYTSRFFGQDILSDGQRHQRAFLANYLTVGYLQDERVVELAPKRRARVLDALSGRTFGDADEASARLVDEAVAYYQIATQMLRRK